MDNCKNIDCPSIRNRIGYKPGERTFNEQVPLVPTEVGTEHTFRFQDRGRFKIQKIGEGIVG